MVPKQQQQSVVDCLIKNIADEHNDHHHTGTTGTTGLIDCLTALGHGEIMWKTGAPADAVDGISRAAETDDNVTFEVDSGSYSFSLSG